MPVVHIKGKVLPEIVKVTVQNLPRLHWEEKPIGLVMDIEVRIINSVIDVQFDVNRYDATVLGELNKRAWDLSRAVVDSYCFASGMGLTVYLDTIVQDNGEVQNLLPNQPSLAAYCTAFDLSPQNTGANNFDAMFRLIAEEPAIAMSLNDLIVSITLPHHSVVNCGRALDGIRVLLTPAGTKRAKGWPIVQAILNADEAYMTFISDTSTGPRHGDRAFIPGTITTEVTNRSWILMNRFFEYRKRNNQPLPLTDFPLLVG